jgi:hypothetical protein
MLIVGEPERLPRSARSLSIVVELPSMAWWRAAWKLELGTHLGDGPARVSGRLKHDAYDKTLSRITAIDATTT